MSNDPSSGETSSDQVIQLVSKLVSSYVSNNTVDSSQMLGLIHQVYLTLTTLNDKHRFFHERPEPAVAVKKSVTDDFIVCLEDGKKLKMLKRHLKTAYNMTPEQYRERWNLPLDYPMVAPNYARKRSDLAKTNGLGRSRSKSQPQALAS